MRRWLIIFLLCAPCFGQAWSNILASSRAINWVNAGLPATITYGSGGSACNGSSVNCVETTTNAWTPPTTRTQCGSTLTPSGGDDTSAINTAFGNCKPGTYIQLSGSYVSPATFNINSQLFLYTYNGITLQGGGAGATIVSVNGPSGYIGMGSNPGNTCSWTAGFSAGTTSITATGCGSQPAVGYLLSMQQCDSGYYSSSGNGSCASGSSIDDSKLYICAQNTACNRGSGEGVGPPFNAQIQTVLITSVSGTCSSSCTIGISPGLYMPNWDYQASGATNPPSPYVTLNQNNTTGLAIQDLTILTTGTLSTAYTLDMNRQYASWIKGVRFLGNNNSAGTPLGILNSKNCLISNNYFFTNVNLTSSFGAGIQEGADADDLVLNNISASGDQWEGTGQQEGIVLAFNYGRDNFSSGVFNFWFNHDGGDDFILYEGNEGAGIQEDNTHGNHNLVTADRNYLSGWDPPYAGSADPNVNTMDAFQRVDNFVGNALGSSVISTYQGNGTGFNYVYQLGYGGGFTDPLTSSSTMLWGNCDTVNGGCRFNSSEVPTSGTIGGNLSAWANTVPSNDNLPCSFYFSVGTSPCSPKYSGGTGLSWWKVCKMWTTFPSSCSGTQVQPFPIAGPELTSGPYVNGYAYDNPAAIAWEYLPVDTTYQNSYTISSSSWSNVSGTCSPAPAPCEILTFGSSVLPNVTHLMGPFQFSGVNSACSTGATFGGNSEILMTNSSSTTVVYSLASNPGVSCTGTMKFPDVRQFDERVYENDPAGTNNPVAPPVNLIIVQQAPRIELEWEASQTEGVDYNIWRSVDNGAFAVVKKGLKQLSWTDTDVTRGTTYGYKSKAYLPPPCSKNCDSIFSDEVSLTCCP